MAPVAPAVPTPMAFTYFNVIMYMIVQLALHSHGTVLNNAL